MQKRNKVRRISSICLIAVVILVSCFVLPCSVERIHPSAGSESCFRDFSQSLHLNDATTEQVLSSSSSQALSMIARAATGNHAFDREAVRGNFYFILAMLIKMAVFSMLMLLETGITQIYSQASQTLLFIHENDGKKRNPSFFRN